MERITVFCSSCNDVEDKFHRLAYETGMRIAQRGHEMVFGASNYGTMASLVKGVEDNRGKIMGIVDPHLAKHIGKTNYSVQIAEDEERLLKLSKYSSGFITLPGGFGTARELIQVAEYKQLGLHNKPIAIVNQFGFFDDLIKFLEQVPSQGFAHPDLRHLLIQVSQNPQEAIEYIENYQPQKIPNAVDFAKRERKR